MGNINRLEALDRSGSSGHYLQFSVENGNKQAVIFRLKVVFLNSLLTKHTHLEQLGTLGSAANTVTQTAVNDSIL